MMWPSSRTRMPSSGSALVMSLRIVLQGEVYWLDSLIYSAPRSPYVRSGGGLERGTAISASDDEPLGKVWIGHDLANKLPHGPIEHLFEELLAGDGLELFIGRPKACGDGFLREQGA